MAGQYGTSFVETEALLAVLSDNTEHAEAIIREMLPNERRDLRHGALLLAETVDEVFESERA